MSAVLCLPGCLRVSAAAFRGQTPHGNASKAFHCRGVTRPSRATRGHPNPEHHGLRSAARQHRRVCEGGVATGTPTSARSFGGPVPAALPALSPTSTTTIGRLGPSPVDRVDHSNRFNNHLQDWSIEGNERRW